MSQDNQTSLRLNFGVLRAPKNAPTSLVRQVESDAQALAVSMLASGHDNTSIAALIAKHPSYVSLMRRGKRAVPERLVGPLCAATGSNLLRQVRDLNDALAEPTPKRERERLANILRSA